MDKAGACFELRNEWLHQITKAPKPRKCCDNYWYAGSSGRATTPSPLSAVCRTLGAGEDAAGEGEDTAADSPQILLQVALRFLLLVS